MHPYSASQQVKIIWAIVAGALFALARFLIGWLVILLFIGDPRTSEVTRGAERLPGIAAFSAGIAGALLWWLLVARQPSLWRGAVTGLLAALSSYVGIGLFGGDDSWGFAFFGAAYTGWAVFPVLALIGVLLSWQQQKVVTP
jgi:hypothetical protein